MWLSDVHWRHRVGFDDCRGVCVRIEGRFSIVVIAGALWFASIASVDAQTGIGDAWRRIFAQALDTILKTYVDQVDARMLVDKAVDGMVSISGPRSRDLVDPGILQSSTDAASARSYFNEAFGRLSRSGSPAGTDALLQAAIRGMLTALDEHSAYINAEDLRNNATRAQVGGIGLELTLEAGLIKVVRSVEGAVASRAGIVCGDVIAAIDGVPVSGLTLPEVVSRLKGPVRSAATLSVVRNKGQGQADTVLIREIVRPNTVRFRTGDDVGYIRISRFGEQTAAAVQTAIEAVRAQIPHDQLKGFIVDLRDNDGGLLDQVVSVADIFLDGGKIVTARGRSGDEIYSAKAGDMTQGKPITVLVNGGTASGAEVLAGALQGHGRATLVGTPSLGNGTVQTIVELGAEAGAMRLTTSRLYTPAGRPIEGEGIAPEITIEQKEGPAVDRVSRSCNSQGTWIGRGDKQLQYAIDRLRRN